MSLMSAIDAVKQSSRHLLRGALLLAVCALVAGPATIARAATEMDLDALTPVSDDKLAEMRGGFQFHGTEISFGVVIETVVNGGAAILRTAFNADSAGGPIVTLNGIPAAPGDTVGAFQLKQAADGGFPADQQPGHENPPSTGQCWRWYRRGDLQFAEWPAAPATGPGEYHKSEHNQRLICYRVDAEPAGSGGLRPAGVLIGGPDCGDRGGRAGGQDP